jgi:hypothetical protein
MSENRWLSAVGAFVGVAALFAAHGSAATGESPFTGEEIERVLRQLPQDPRITDIYKQLIGAGPLPSGG